MAVLLSLIIAESSFESLGLENFLIFVFKVLVFATVSFFLFSFFLPTHASLVRLIFCIRRSLPRIIFVLILICFYSLDDGSLLWKVEAYRHHYHSTLNYCIPLEKKRVITHLFIPTNYPDLKNSFFFYSRFF